MKPYSFDVPLLDATDVLTGTLTQMESEMAKGPSQSKLKLTLIDDGSAQKLFTSLRAWITEHDLSERIHLHRATGEKCTLKVQIAEGEKLLGKKTFPKPDMLFIPVFSILETFLIFLNRLRFSVLSLL